MVWGVFRQPHILSYHITQHLSVRRKEHIHLQSAEPSIIFVFKYALGCIDLAYCDTLYADLKNGLQGLILESCLHLIYLTTPYDMIPQCSPDWMIYFKQVCFPHPQNKSICPLPHWPSSLSF